MSLKLGMLCVLTVILAGCGTEPLPERSSWAGTLQLDGGKALAFRMELDLASEEPVGYFLVGNERVPIPEISRDGHSLAFKFSEYGAEMHGVWDGRSWKGEYLRHRAEGTKSFPFSASPDSQAPPGGAAAGPAPPVGKHQVRFQDEDGSGRATIAQLWRNGESLYGTFIAPDGDYGLLEGKVTGNSIQLHRFTGWQAFLIELIPGEPQWSGTFYAASNETPRAFTLGPSGDLDIEASLAAQTSMKNPNGTFEFACSSLEGEPVRHTDERFRGKALVVDIMGTWCHNCLDEAPVLQQLEEEFQKDGFEVVGLSFEVSDDPAIGTKNLNLYRERFDLTYTLLFCGGMDDANLDARLKSQLNNFFAFPTTLFIDKGGKVRTIHAGFRGPGTGELYPAQVQKLYELAGSVLSNQF